MSNPREISAAVELLPSTPRELSVAVGEDMTSAMKPFTVVAQRLGHSGEYIGAPLRHVQGNLAFESNRRDVWVETPIYCTGDLVIGKGTVLHVAGNTLVGGELKGGGSLIVSLGRVEASGIILGGDLTAGLDVTSKSIIRIGKSLRSGESVDAPTGIIVAGDLAAVDIGCELGDVKVGGRIDADFSLMVKNVQTGGDLNCRWLDAKGTVNVGGSLKSKNDIHAGRSIVARGTIRAGRRIFAGLLQGERATAKDQVIRCAAVLSGKVTRGELQLTGCLG